MSLICFANLNVETKDTSFKGTNLTIKTNEELKDIKIYKKTKDGKYILFFYKKSNKGKDINVFISKNNLSTKEKTDFIIRAIDKDSKDVTGSISVKPIPELPSMNPEETAKPSWTPPVIPTKPSPNPTSSSPANPSAAPSSSAAVKPTSIKLDKEKLVLILDEEGKNKAKLKLTILPQNAQTKLTWEVADKKICTTDTNGNVTAKSVGKTTITVTTDNGKKAVCQVEVKKKSGFDLQHAIEVSAKIHADEHKNLRWHGKVIDKNGGMIGAYVEAINILNGTDYTLKEVYNKIIQEHPEQKDKNKPVYENEDVNDFYNIKVTREKATISNIKKALSEGKVIAEMADTTKWRNDKGKTFGKDGRHTGLIFYFDGEHYHMKTSVQPNGIYTEEQLKDWLKDAEIDLIIYSRK